MTTLVIGAHGRVGQFVVQQLAATGETVYGGVRNAQQSTTIERLGATARLIDLLATPDQLMTALTDVDTVVFTAGSGGQTGDDMTLNIDLDGAIKAMIATKQAGIKRFIMVSALGADDRTFWDQSGIRPYYVAKHYADDWLQHRSGLDYTIIRPGLLTDDDPSGKIAIDSTRTTDRAISRQDVAATVVALVKHPLAKQTFTIIHGDQPIQTAIANR